MRPNPRFVFLLGALALAVPAQGSPQQTQKIARCDRPLRQVSLDLATGTITRGPAIRERAVATVADFTNLDLAGFVGVDSGAGACEWIDAATKGFRGNASDLMSRIVFAYCSAALDVASGGPGGAVQLGFYEGYTVGGPAPTPSTGVGLFTLSGLPASTAHSSFPAQGFRCYFIEVSFADLVSFADGAIGYSWLFTDLGTDGVFAATFPFVSCIQNCSAAGPDGQGMVNLLDQYCPPGNFLRSFRLGGLEDYFTSIAMEVREAADWEATASEWNGTGVNVDRLLSSAIVVGRPWSPTLTLGHAHGSGGPMALSVRQNCVSGTVASSPLGGRTVQLLTQGPLGLKLSATHDGTSGSFPAFAVPRSIALVCQPWAAQAVVLGGGFADLTSARCGIVGTIDAVPDP